MNLFLFKDEEIFLTLRLIRLFSVSVYLIFFLASGVRNVRDLVVYY